MMKVSFSEFVLRYLDEWNFEARYLAEDLYVTHNSLNAWIYRGCIPNSDNIKIIENYFGEAFENVVFDGKAFRRKFKIIRTDGSSRVYDTNTELSETELVAESTITRCCRDGEAVKKGKLKGWRFDVLPKPIPIYAFYEADELLGMGTLDELSEEHGITVSTLEYYFYQHHRPDTNRRVVLVDWEFQELEVEE